MNPAPNHSVRNAAKPTAEPKPVALMFEIDGDVAKRCYVLYNVTLGRPPVNSSTINESKTHPRITSLDDLGFLTSSVNSSQMVRDEIKNYLDGTEFSNIYCFPSTMENKDGEMVFAVRFVVYPSRRYTNF